MTIVIESSLDALVESCLPRVIDAVIDASAAVMAVYATNFAVSHKDDRSPVTAADERAEAILVARLAKLTPDIPIVAEEAVAAGQVVRPGRRFWLVDPLDGTKEFVSRNGEFTVNIACIDRGEPVAGVVFAPAQQRLFAGARGLGAFVEEQGKRRVIRTRRPPQDGLTLWSSRSHGSAARLRDFVASQHWRVAENRHAGSSLKFGLLAAGEGDVYPRLSRTMEWDTAAGHAVLSAAGGAVVGLDGKPLAYGKPGFENPGFVAWGRPPGPAAAGS